MFSFWPEQFSETNERKHLPGGYYILFSPPKQLIPAQPITPNDSIPNSYPSTPYCLLNVVFASTLLLTKPEAQLSGQSKVTLASIKKSLFSKFIIMKRLTQSRSFWRCPAFRGLLGMHFQTESWFLKIYLSAEAVPTFMIEKLTSSIDSRHLEVTKKKEGNINK